MRRRICLSNKDNGSGFKCGWYGHHILREMEQTEA